MKKTTKKLCIQYACHNIYVQAYTNCSLSKKSKN